jgi:hypothetical protein
MIEHDMPTWQEAKADLLMSKSTALPEAYRPQPRGVQALNREASSARCYA